MVVTTVRSRRSVTALAFDSEVLEHAVVVRLALPVIFQQVARVSVSAVAAFSRFAPHRLAGIATLFTPLRPSVVAGLSVGAVLDRYTLVCRHRPPRTLVTHESIVAVRISGAMVPLRPVPARLFCKVRTAAVMPGFAFVGTTAAVVFPPVNAVPTANLACGLVTTHFHPVANTPLHSPVVAELAMGHLLFGRAFIGGHCPPLAFVADETGFAV